MNNELRERDSLWCKALVATLGIEEIARVTAEFNRIRPDKAVEHSVQADAACACPRVKGEIYHIVGCPVIFYESLRR